MRGLHCRLGGRRVLHGVDLEVRPGETLGILGPNGSGKTTLLRCIAGLEPPERGSVTVDGLDVAATSPGVLARHLAMQLQDSPAALGFTVEDVVAMGRLAHRGGPFGRQTSRDREVVAACIAAFELDGLADRLVESLSGGERQRVLIARAVAQEPSCLLLDEPTNHLDIAHQFAVLGHVTRLGATVVATLHDLQLAGRLCDRVVVMQGGRIVADGVPHDVLTSETIGAVWEVAATVGRQPGGPITIDLRPL